MLPVRASCQSQGWAHVTHDLGISPLSLAHTNPLTSLIHLRPNPYVGSATATSLSPVTLEEGGVPLCYDLPMTFQPKSVAFS